MTIYVYPYSNPIYVHILIKIITCMHTIICLDLVLPVFFIVSHMHNFVGESSWVFPDMSGALALYDEY